MNNKKCNFYYFALIYLIAFSLAIVGCATQSKSIGFGGAIGAGGGAMLGGIADPGKNGEYRTRNVIVGAALGGMAGMVAGSVIHENTEKQKQEAFAKGQASAPKKSQGEMPSLKNPKVEARWVDAKSAGNRYIEGHWEYIIIEPARWNGAE
ncbi:MAG: hypothetical protein SGJ18_00970 [Pseudomonadota bacterium]|nr:hypothetical protein [Pseudomonadota bacterium]